MHLSKVHNQIKPNYNKGPFGYLEVYDNIENVDYDDVLKSAMIMGYFSKEDKDTLSINTSYYKEGKEYKNENIDINKDESKNTVFQQIV